MKAAVMQPYLFPYLGYFQLIESVDVFVFYNDVNYIKGGWINRNRILLNGKPHYFTVSCNDASPNKLICDIDTVLDKRNKRKLLSLVSQTYARAPFHKEVMDILEDVFNSADTSLSNITIKSIRAVCEYLDIKKEWRISSEDYQNRDMRRDQRLIDICHREQCDTYRNPIGGQELYHADMFSPYGISLQFVKPQLAAYKQWDDTFVPGLSIIDVLMFNDKQSVKSMLKEYTII